MNRCRTLCFEYAAAHRISGLAAAALVASIGCAQLPPKPSGAVAEPSTTIAAEPVPAPRPAPPAAPQPETDLPKQDLNETVLYEFLLAEIAAQRGNVGLAAQAYLDLAKRTRDPRIARRATEIALFARMNNTAVDAARVWRETEPTSQRALQTLGGLLITSGRFDEALPVMKSLLAQGTSNPGESFLQLNRLFGGNQDKSAALSLVQRLAEDYPQLAQARFAVAQAAFNAGQSDIALKEIRRAQELRPDWEVAVLMEAQFLQRTSNSEAVTRLSRFLDRYPNSREVRLSRARLLVSDRRYNEARAEFQKLLADFPANPDVIYSVALLSMQLSDYTVAEANFRRLLELDFQDKPAVRLYLGQVAEEQGKFADALRWYGEITHGDQYFGAQIRFAQVLAKQGKLAEGRSHLQQLSVSDPQQRTQLVLAEAQMLRDSGQPADAFALLGGALEKTPDSPELLYDYAMIAERIGRIELTESTLRRLIELRPDHAHAYNALGYTLADRSLRLAEAHELIDQALKLAPGDAFIIDSMGWVLFRMGNIAESLKYLRQAYAGRSDPEIAAHLAEVLWASGERSEAEGILKEAAQKHPKNEIIQNTIERLKR